MQEVESSTSLAGFWPRVGAFLIDLLCAWGSAVLVLSLVMALISPFGWADVMTKIMVGLTLVAVALYGPLFESSKYMATPGKMLLRLRVTDLQGQRLSFLRAVSRNLVKLFAGKPTLMIGWCIAAATPRRQALHDMAAKTLVVNANQ